MSNQSVQIAMNVSMVTSDKVRTARERSKPQHQQQKIATVFSLSCVSIDKLTPELMSSLCLWFHLKSLIR